MRYTRRRSYYDDDPGEEEPPERNEPGEEPGESNEPNEPNEPNEEPPEPPEPGAGPGEPGFTRLLQKAAGYGLDDIPSVTFFVLTLKVLLFLKVIKLPWEKVEICLSATHILNHEYKRMIFSVFEHIDEKHLYFNLMSFMFKARTLENRYGHTNFAFLLSFMIIWTNLVYVALAIIGVKVSDMQELMTYCSIGFSGVVFALKVITTAETGQGNAFIMGIKVHTKYAAWAEIIAIRHVVPESSTFAHVAGVVAGLLYMGTSVGYFVDTIIGSLTGTPVQKLPYLSSRAKSGEKTKSPKRSRKPRERNNDERNNDERERGRKYRGRSPPKTSGRSPSKTSGRPTSKFRGRSTSKSRSRRNE